MTRPGMLESARSDLRYALRSFARSPTFAVATVLTLALGIGVSVAMFGVLHAVLLRPLPIRDQSRTMLLWGEAKGQPGVHLPLRNGFLSDVAKNAHSFSDVGAVVLGGATPFMARDQERAFPMAVSLVNGGYFPALGVVPQLGRMLAPSDDEAGAVKAIVISDRIWRQQFASDPKIVGRSIDLQGSAQTIVGVAPRGFDYPAGTDAWSSFPQLEFRFSSTPNPDGGWYDFIGRLKPGVSREVARAELQAMLFNSSSRTLPAADERVAGVAPIADFIVGNERPAILILSVAVALLLIMTCVNLAGLLLTRGLSRAGEFSMRASLGATRKRLVGQLMLESSLLAGVGGALGVLIAAALLRIAVVLAPPALARFNEIRLDLPALVFAVVLTVGCVVTFALPPALRTAGSGLDQLLRQASKSVTGGGWKRGGTRPNLVIAQIAITVIVLVMSGLLLRTLVGLQRLNLGYEPRHLVFIVMQGTDAGGDENAANQRLESVMDAMVERLPKQRGIVAAVPISAIPFDGVSGAPVIEQHFAIEGQAVSDGLKSPSILGFAATPDYFKALGIPLVRGRSFTINDGPSGPRVCVVSQALAALAWPGQDPIGKQLRIITEDGPGRPRTVVGEVGDVRFKGLHSATPAMYAPTDMRFPYPFMAIRTTGDPRLSLATIKSVLAGVDHSFAVRASVTMPELLATQFARPRLLSTVLGSLSIAALVLAALGGFSVLALMVSLRSQEFGVRLALGATSRAIRAMVLSEGWRLTSIGIAIGLIIALAGTRVLRSQLYAVSPADPLTIATAIAFLFAIATLAYYIPARRAGNADPVIALRND